MRAASSSLRRTVSIVVAVASACVLSSPARADDADVCVTAAEASQPLRREGKLRLARDKLLLCSRASCPDVVAVDCRKWLSDVESKLASISLHVTSGDDHPLRNTRISIDDELINLDATGLLYLEPGKRKLHVESDGMAAFDAEITLRRGEHDKPVVAVLRAPVASPERAPSSASATPSERPPDDSSHVAPWLFGAASVAAIGVGSYFWVSGRSDYANLRDTCGETRSCAASDVHSLKTKLVVGDVLVGAGLISAGVGLWLALSSPSSASPSSVGLAPTAGGALVSYSVTLR